MRDLGDERGIVNRARDAHAEVVGRQRAARCGVIIAPVRVMHVESGRHLYGGARQTADLIGGLDALGLDNVLVATAGGDLARTPLPATCVALPIGGDADWRLVARLAAEIARHAPDVVHVHSRRGADVYGGRAAARCGVPGLVTRRVDSREPVPWLRFKYRPYGLVVAISSAIERDLTERAGLEARRVARIPSAVDAARFAPDAAARARLAAALGVDAATPLVGIVGQLIERKGHGVLLSAWPRVRARCADARLVVLGRGSRERALRRGIAAAGLQTSVHLLGHRDDLPALVPGLDVLVHPAHREGLGLAVLEAMSAGVPVVAAAAGGLVDVVAPGVNGELFAPGDAGALADAIARLLAEPDTRARLGAAARARMIERHSIGAMSRAYAKLYARLAPQAGPLHAVRDPWRGEEGRDVRGRPALPLDPAAFERDPRGT